MVEPQHDIDGRLREFVASSSFAELPEESLSDYWRHYHERIRFSFGETTEVSGDSGIYIPTRPRSLLQKFASLCASPGPYSRLIVQKVLRRLMIQSGMLFDLSEIPVDAAFDTIMSNHPESRSTLNGPFIDFTAVLTTPGVYTDSQDVTRDYLALSNGIPPNNYVFLAYFYTNILKYFGVMDGSFSFVEIGAGNGNLTAQMLRHRKGTSFIVDLPRTLVGSISFLASMYPELSFVLPHEAETKQFQAADLVFLTPAQINLIPNRSCTLVTNTHSFQEMTCAQITIYFDLIDRILMDGGHLFSVNRVEKCSTWTETPDSARLPEVIRASEYPWSLDWVDRAHQVCPMSRLLGRDNWDLRLVQKPQ